MARRVSEDGLRVFYARLWIPYASRFILEELCTLGGRCKMVQREVVLQMWDYQLRQYVFRTVGDVVAELQTRLDKRWGEHIPVNLHVGPVWSAHHLAPDQPKWPYGAPKEYPIDYIVPKDTPPDMTPTLDPTFVPNIDALKPRKWERKERCDSAWGELVIDVDMDAARRVHYACPCPCGLDARVCQVCWTLFMLPAQRILTYLIRDYFHLIRFFTIFSGRRGFHIWILDDAVLQWSGSERRSFTSRLTAPLRHARGKPAEGIPPHVAREPLNDFIWDTVIRDLARPGQSRAEAFAMLYPDIDADVSAKLEHLHKLPLMLNANTGWWCDLMADPDDEEHRFIASLPQLATLQLTQLEPMMFNACIARMRQILKK